MHVLCKIAFSLDWFQFGWEHHHVVLWWKPSETTSINSLSSLSRSRHTMPNKTMFSLAPSTLPQCYPQKLCTLKTLPLSSHHTVVGATHTLTSMLWKCYSERLQHCHCVVSGIFWPEAHALWWFWTMNSGSVLRMLEHTLWILSSGS